MFNSNSGVGAVFRLYTYTWPVASITVGMTTMTTAVQVYKVKELQWTQTTQIQPQSHPYDRFLWDPVKQQHTVEVFIEDLRSR